MESCAQRAMSLISSDMEEMVFCIDAESLVNRRTSRCASVASSRAC